MQLIIQTLKPNKRYAASVEIGMALLWNLESWITMFLQIPDYEKKSDYDII